MVRRRKYRKDPMDYIRLPSVNLDPDIKKGIFIVFILAFGAISLLSLFDLAGVLGDYLNRAMLLLFGWGRWLFPIILLALGFLLYNENKLWVRGANYLGLFLFAISFSGLLHLFITQADWQETIKTGAGGGYLGFIIVLVLNKIMGFWASLITVVCLLIISLMLMFNAGLEAIIGRESWLVKLFYPINFLFSKIFKGSGVENEYEIEEELEGRGEGGEEKEGEGAEEFLEDEIEGGGFTSHKIKAKTDLSAKEDKGKQAWKPTHIKIDLPLDLLSSRIGKPTSGDIKSNLMVIQKTLENFGIPVEMGEVSVGPTVTQYTLKPAEGIKLSRITTLSNDLALALAAHPIRIEAPIPGKSLVGVEVPNQVKAVVGLREVLSDPSFKERKSSLMVGLGKDVSGKVWFDDLGKMPHLLVAGATNSGKSVCLNSIIVSLLYQNNPDDLRFIMVDPKMVELPIYNGIPHLLTPVITEVAKTINALKWCLNEMDRRFEILAKSGKRNIDSYNTASNLTQNGESKMPYIVFIIDELAHLMVASPRDVEAGVIRLAQMARAVGIHLVLATQRPSVDVITGLIKANMPARIAFSVASGVDSRTILDSLGAEKLLGRGDMLFTTANLSKPKRLQGAFVSDNDIKKIVNYIKDRGGQPEYIEDVVEKQKVRGIAGFGLEKGSLEEDDEMLEQAKEMIINSGKASASFLQRRLSIGYARAARLLDLLEAEGVIGPGDGAKPREVLISREQYDSIISQGVSSVALHKQGEVEEKESYLDEEAEDESGEEEEVEEKNNSLSSEDEGNQIENKDENKIKSKKKVKKRIENNELFIAEDKEDGEDEGKYFLR